MNWLGLNHLVFWIARKILGLLVRTKIQPNDLATLNIDPNKPICYVLRDRSLSDLLVLDQECKNVGLPRPTAGLSLKQTQFIHAAFFLMQPRRAFSRKQPPNAEPDKLVSLVEDVLQEPGRDIQLVPVSIFWGRNPDKEKSIFKLLFSDSWVVPGWFRKLFIILAQGRQTIVTFNEPVSIAGLIQQTEAKTGALDQPRLVRKISRLLRVHFRRQRETVVGPDLSHRRTIVDSLLNQANIVRIIEQEAAQSGQRIEKIRYRAQQYADEIAADYSYPVIRLFELVLSWIWNRLYDGITISNFEKLAKVAQNNVVIYVPCHRSHIDYLLLSYVLHQNGLVPPHIAAGINLNLPILGGILRRGGAFFMRRSFKGNPLYAAIFNEYLNLVFEKGFSVEYFIEGGRSRTGRLLQPRPGMLAMTLRSYLRSQRRSFVFVPVYFGYERIIEGRTYVGELYGAGKKKESLLGLLRTLRKIRGTFGQVQVNFGDPILLDRFLDDINPNWRNEPSSDTTSPDWISTTLTQLGQRIATHINNGAVVTPVSLLSLILLATPRRAIAEHTLLQQLERYQALLEAVPYSASMVRCAQSSEQIIAYGEKLEILQRHTHPLGDILRVDDDKAMQLTYFRNNNIHLLAIPSLIACLLTNNRQIDTTSLLTVCTQMYPFLRSELFLKQDTDRMEENVGVYLELFESYSWISLENGRLCTAPPSSDAFVALSILSRIIRPTLERFYIAINILLSRGSGTLQREQLENLCSLTAERISLLHEFNAPEFFDKALFRNFLEALTQHSMIWEENDTIAFDSRLAEAELGANLILSEELRHTIQQVTQV
jgi:glycerol-3-phosphate O-acyltransferase